MSSCSTRSSVATPGHPRDTARAPPRRRLRRSCEQRCQGQPRECALPLRSFFPSPAEDSLPTGLPDTATVHHLCTSQLASEGGRGQGYPSTRAPRDPATSV